MKNYVLGLFCGLIFNLYGQEKPSPYGAVTNFFNAFHAKDSIAMQSIFHQKARLLRSGNRNGQPVISENDLQLFIRSVSTRTNSPVWEERLGDPIVQQNQDLATVWVPFHFYLDDRLSHCGFNSFTLVWNGSSWKILSLIDTATKECDLIPI